MNFEIRILVGVSAEHNILPTVSCKKKKNNSFFLLKDSFYLYCCFFVLNQATTPMKSVSHCLIRYIHTSVLLKVISPVFPRRGLSAPGL